MRLSSPQPEVASLGRPGAGSRRPSGQPRLRLSDALKLDGDERRGAPSLTRIARPATSTRAGAIRSAPTSRASPAVPPRPSSSISSTPTARSPPTT